MLYALEAENSSRVVIGRSEVNSSRVVSIVIKIVPGSETIKTETMQTDVKTHIDLTQGHIDKAISVELLLGVNNLI